MPDKISMKDTSVTNRAAVVLVSQMLCLGMAFAGPVTAEPSAKVYRVAYMAMSTATTAAPYVDALKMALRDLGYVEGRNLVIDVRWAEGHPERFPAMAAELIALHPDVIVTAPPIAVDAARKATSKIPIVMIAAFDPLGRGLVASLAHPGGNITGLSGQYEALTGKYLELLHTTVPKAKRIAVLYYDGPGMLKALDEIKTPATGIGLTVLPEVFKSIDDIDKAFSSMKRRRAQAMIVLGLLNGSAAHWQKIADLARRANLPSIAQGGYAEVGGLMNYGPNFMKLFRRSATYVDKILKGAKPADLPVEQPTEFELVVNLKTAKDLGIKMPQEILLRASKVIE